MSDYASYVCNICKFETSLMCKTYAEFWVCMQLGGDTGAEKCFLTSLILNERNGKTICTSCSNKLCCHCCNRWLRFSSKLPALKNDADAQASLQSFWTLYFSATGDVRFLLIVFLTLNRFCTYINVSQIVLKLYIYSHQKLIKIWTALVPI